ncbi:hypothetical protein D3C86_1226800 [compost metagenome]
MTGVVDAEHGVATGGEGVLVGGKLARQQAGLVRDACGAVLLGEVDPHAAGQEEVHGVGLLFAQARDFHREVELAQLGVELLDHLALEEPFEARGGIAPGRIVGRDQHHALELLVLCVLAGSFMHGIVLPAHAEEAAVALRTRVLRRTRIRAEIDVAVFQRDRRGRQQDVRIDDAREHLHLVLLDQPLGDLLGSARVELVVRDDQPGRLPADLARELLDGQLDAVSHVDARHGLGTAQRRHDADAKFCGAGSGHAGARHE